MPNVTSFGRSVGGVTTALTAGATQTAAGATALTGAINTVTVVAADNDGVILPADCAQGDTILVANLDSAQDIKVWPNTGATINGAAATTAALVVGQQQSVQFTQIGTSGLTWIAILGAVATPA
jgi:hypothetical protein